MSLQQLSYILGTLIFLSVLGVSIFVLVKHKYMKPWYKDYYLWSGLLYSTVSIMFMSIYIRLYLNLPVPREELQQYIFLAGFALLMSMIEVSVRLGLFKRFHK